MRKALWPLTLSISVTTAWATPPDTIGLSARSIGSGGGGVAWIDDPTASYVNPAGLSQLDQPEAQIGLLISQESFRELPPVYWDTNRDGVVDERDEALQVSSNIDDTIGFSAATGRNVGKKFGIGLSLYVPARQLVRFMTYEPSLPTYFMHFNRPQRLVLAMGVGGTIAPGVHIGTSLELVPGSQSTLVATVSGGLHGANEDGGVLDPIIVDVHQTSITLKSGGSPVVGIQLEFGQWTEALRGLRMGIVWRGAADMDGVLPGNAWRRSTARILCAVCRDTAAH